MNYTIQEIIDMNTEFILISSRGRYSAYIGELCTIRLNPSNNCYEMRMLNYINSNRCYQVNHDSNVKAWTKEENPEYFL